jgi:hypothetical protein
MSAEIFRFRDYQIDNFADNEIGLETAVDAAIRDLREILLYWGTEEARQRAKECQLMLCQVFSESIVGRSGA